jgi:hypothetical protein
MEKKAGIIVFRHAEDKDGDHKNVTREIPKNVKVFDEKGDPVDSIKIRCSRLCHDGKIRAKLFGEILPKWIATQIIPVTHVIVQDPRLNHEPTTSNPYDTVRFYLEEMGQLVTAPIKVHFSSSYEQTIEYATRKLSENKSVMICATRQRLWGDDNSHIDSGRILGSLNKTKEPVTYPEKGKTIYIFDDAYKLTEFHVSDSTHRIKEGP